MSRKNLSFALLSTAIVMAVMAAATLLPLPSSKISDLGYYALCPFAPWSTLALLLLAGLCWVVRQYIDSKPD